MLFVFQVDTGRMMTFDMSLALESIQNLKVQVEKAFKISVNQQVLLISGGQHLRPDDRVCAYPAGTDTNPIFLFSKPGDSSTPPPAASADYGSDPDLSSKVKDVAELPPTYSAVQKRTLLARQFCDAAKEQLATCEKLVHEQHLQQQGWAAVVANLEDLSADLTQRWKLYKEAFSEYIAKRNFYLEYLNHYKDDLLILQKIPVLPALIESQKLLVPEREDDFAEKTSENETSSGMSLFKWIEQKDPCLRFLFDGCSKGLLKNDENVFLSLEVEVTTRLAMTNDKNMKEIKGIGDRLFGLETLMKEAKTVVVEQAKLAESFQKNHNTATQFKDSSVLPDLCSSHQKQLNVLLENHNRLRGITRRCVLAKNELSSNLYHRLKWIGFMQETICELDNNLVLNYENLTALQEQMAILRQVHTAPATYLSTIVEIVRRRKVSQAFLLWASDVACHLLTVYNEEIARRKDFQSQIEGHFLGTLFPGMEDFPPTFATQAPSIYDSALPKLTEDDVEKLRIQLPDYASFLEVPDTSVVTNYFLLKEPKDDIDRVVAKVEEIVAEARNLEEFVKQVPSTSHGLPLLKDFDKGCESETDTEEFEKVGQSPFELHFEKAIPSPRSGIQDASTLTEENLQISRSDYEKLRLLLVRFSECGRQAYNQLRTELVETKNHLLREKVLVEEACCNLGTNINNLLSSREHKEREIVQRLTVDHELEISDFRKIAQSKNEEIKCLRDGNARLRGELQEATAKNERLKKQLEETGDERSREIEEMKRKIDDLVLEKDRCVKEITERLKTEHRGEIESIRARFKLMTMERSPSENSLEKIERGDLSSISNPEALLKQMQENFESEKVVAVSDAISKESEKWQNILDERLKQKEEEHEQEKAFIVQDVQNRMQDDQDKLREQIDGLIYECTKYKDTIQRLSECRDNNEVNLNESLNQIVELEKENAVLRTKLEKYKEKESTGMAASVAVCEGATTSDAATSPVRTRKRSEVSLTKSCKLNTDSCRIEDLVLVVWDVEHQNFRIFQEGSSLYFVNADCLESLGLRIKDGKPNKFYCYGEVVDKEYCHARKDEPFSVIFQPVNRFRVPLGTKFFRVKLKTPAALEEYQATLAAKAQALTMSQSQTTTTSQTEVAITGPSQSLPSSPSRRDNSASRDSAIPEELGEDSQEESGKHEDVEKGTELTENFNVGIQSSIDR